MGKRKPNSGGVASVLPPKEIEWILPADAGLSWGPQFYEISDNLYKLGLTTGEHLMLEKMCRFLFDRGRRALPKLSELARIMGLSLSSAWRHLSKLVEHGLVDVIERKPGMAHKLSLAPLFQALRRVLGIDAEQEDYSQDSINAALANFAAETHRAIRNVNNYRQRLDAAAEVAGWNERELFLIIREVVPAAKIAHAVRDPVGYLVRTVELKAANIGRERIINEPQEERAQPPEESSAGPSDRAEDAGDYESGPSALPANPSAVTPGDEPGPEDDLDRRGNGDGVLGGLGEETNIPPDGWPCLWLAWQQRRERGAWPFIPVRADRQGWAVSPNWDGPFGWKAFAERGTPAEHQQATRKLWERLDRLKDVPPLAAAGGD